MLYSVRDAAVAHRRRSLRTGRADKVGYLQHKIHLAAFHFEPCSVAGRKLNLKNSCKILCTCCLLEICSWFRLVSCHVAESGTHRSEGWNLEGSDDKGISFGAVPLLSMSVSFSNLFCSPSLSICLHLAPTGEGQSIDLLSLFPESGVKSAQGPPSSGPALALCRLVAGFCYRDRPAKGPTQASQGPHKEKKSLSRTKAWETALHNVASSE